MRQMLNRFVKAGELNRAARGVFVKPKHVSKVGAVMPSAEEIAAMLSQSTGETIAVHGAEAARQLQLTTQVPMRFVFYTSGNSRTLRMVNRSVTLKHVNPSRLVLPGTVSGLIFSALYYLGKEHATIETLEKIKQRVSKKEFTAMFNLMDRMPAWMSDLFYRY